MLFYLWMYQFFVYDIFNVKFNRIIIEMLNDEMNFVKGLLKKFYDLIVLDFFWVKNVGVFFFQVVEEIDFEFLKWKEDMQVLIRKIGVQDIESLM